MKRGFVNNELLMALLMALLLFSLAVIFILGGAVERVLVGSLVVGFVLFANWFIWKTTLRPGDHVRVLRGEHGAQEGTVHLEHNPQHLGRVRVVLAEDGEPMIHELSQYNVEKI